MSGTGVTLVCSECGSDTPVMGLRMRVRNGWACQQWLYSERHRLLELAAKTCEELLVKNTDVPYGDYNCGVRDCAKAIRKLLGT